MKNAIKLTVIIALAVLMTACCKSEKKELNGTWLWYQTTELSTATTVSPSDYYCTFKLVFAGNHFIFYRDNTVIATGLYKIQTFESSYGSTYILSFPKDKCHDIYTATGGRIAIFEQTNLFLNDNRMTLYAETIISDFYKSE